MTVNHVHNNRCKVILKHKSITNNELTFRAFSEEIIETVPNKFCFQNNNYYSRENKLRKCKN